MVVAAASAVLVLVGKVMSGVGVGRSICLDLTAMTFTSMKLRGKQDKDLCDQLRPSEHFLAKARPSKSQWMYLSLSGCA